MLEKDIAVFESVRRHLKLAEDIRQQVSVLDRLGEKLHRNSETFSEKVSIAILRQIKESEKTTALKELTEAQKISNDLRLAIVFLTNYGRQMLLADEQERITHIRDDKIAQTVRNIEMFLDTLAGFTFYENINQAELFEIIQNVKKEYELLRLTLIGKNDSIVSLQSQWITERENILSLNMSLKEITDFLTASLEDIKLAADQVRYLAEEDAANVNITSQSIIWSVSIGVILFMVVVGMIITRRIILPIGKAESFAAIISNGDLTAEIEKDHDDEVGNLVSKLSSMAHNLNMLIGQVQRSGIQVTSSATELSATSRQQEAVMKTQLESTNYVVKAVREISTVSEDLVETMQRVAVMSEQTAEFANSGQTDLSQMEEAMHHMENASKSISGKLEAINEKAANITSVVTTITKVADQTNLLSLNAAIEAEKAGEYGRGFTVVAREIRRLADQTAVATLDIDQMVQEMQSAVSAGVMEMDAFITEVQRSAENVGKISMQLSRIIEQVQGLSPSFEGVNESMQFQSEKAQQINNSMMNLSEEMQQTVDSLRESFLAIEQLNDAAKGLQDEVSRFRVM